MGEVVQARYLLPLILVLMLTQPSRSLLAYDRRRVAATGSPRVDDPVGVAAAASVSLWLRPPATPRVKSVGSSISTWP